MDAPHTQRFLIVENDIGFAKVLLEAARQQGFKGIVTGSGAAALAVTREYQPSVVTLDIFLPDMQGWRVLDRLKEDLTTRHIPVCVVSTDDARERALDSGAFGFIAKPLKSRDMVDKAQVMAVLPYGKGTVTLVEGGLEIPNDRGTDSTIIANACVVVSLDIA